jgi:hypothetical protein
LSADNNHLLRESELSIDAPLLHSATTTKPVTTTNVSALKVLR